MIHPSFNLINYFYAHPDSNKLKMDKWIRGSKHKVKAVYLLVLEDKIIKVGQSIDFYRRMNDYKYRIGYACKVLTPELNKLIRKAGEPVKIYVRFYDQELYRIDEWGEKVLQTDCVFAAEKKWKEIYNQTLIFE
jgi:hypothetical protein